VQPRNDEFDTTPAPTSPDPAVLEQLRIPMAMRPAASQIIALTDAWCAAALDEQYAALTRQVTARLARKRPSPLERGRRRIWAAGVLYAVGQLNFLLDDHREPHLTSDDLHQLTSVASSTMSNKAKLVRDTLGLTQFDPAVSRDDVGDQCPNPLITMHEGRVVDLAQMLALVARRQAQQ